MHLSPVTVKLARGSHAADTGQACVMELVSCLAGESWSDSPQCVSPIIAAFMRQWNDQLGDEDREMLKELIPVVIGTRTHLADEMTRSWLAVDWLLRTHTTSWLDLAGLGKQADAVRNGPQITNGELLAEAMPALITARDSAAAARAAARDAAGAAAWAAAGDAAGAAARAAAGAKLKPTISALQKSAIELVKRMAQVGRP